MNIPSQPKAAVLTAALALGMTGLAMAQSNTTSSTNSSQTPNAQTEHPNKNPYSQTEVKSAQQKLKDDGYYNGKIDGSDGPMTRAAIRKYQKSQNLTVNGRLDQQTIGKLGVQQQ